MFDSRKARGAVALDEEAQPPSPAVEASTTAAEEYELQPSSTDHDNADDNEPLLPSYDTPSPSALHRGTPMVPKSLRPSGVASGTPGRARRRSRSVCFYITVVGAGLVVALVVAGVVRSVVGETAQGWSGTVDGVKEWIGEMVGNLEESDPAFPTNIGYEGPTPTGSEAALLATAPALPLYTAIAPLVPPANKDGASIFQYWAHLSPYHSVKSHGLKSSSLVPDTCEIKGLHWLQRHGARYPTGNQDSGPGAVAKRMAAVKGWKAKGDLAFLNDWTYKLGSDILTPYGRSQLFNLGVAARLKYGFLLDDMDGRLPVFRTESQNRMLRSAQNFATGFFGYPAEEQYHLEVGIEAPDFNCTLAPYYRCPKDDGDHGGRAAAAQWDTIFLSKALKRLQKNIDGYEFTIKDLENFMELCAYETVALGYSSFCPLFTEKEWKGFEYRMDIMWWYSSSFGSPYARAQGLGWVQELTARLSHTPLTVFNSTTNSTLHDEVHFPVNDPIYVDFTHDTVFATLMPTLNLTSFAQSGEPNLEKIPKDWSFMVSKICPFGTNMQVQVLECGGESSNKGSTTVPDTEDDEEDDDQDDDDDDEDKKEDRRNTRPTKTERSRSARSRSRSTSKRDSSNSFVRIILNDAPVPLTGIQRCPENEDGLCPLDTFISAMHTIIGSIDFEQVCLGA